MASERSFTMKANLGILLLIAIEACGQAPKTLLPPGAPTGTLGVAVLYSPSAPLNVKAFGAIGDNSSHPLSDRFPTLAAARAIYPFVTSLTQEIDYAGIEAALRSVHYLGQVYLPTGRYVINTPISIGEGSYIALELAGQEGFGGANGDFPQTTITNTTGGDVLDIVIPSGQTHNLLIRGLQLASCNSGNVIHFAGGYPVGVILDKLELHGGAYGVNFTTGSLSATISNSVFSGQTTAGVHFAGSSGNNLPRVSNSYFQSELGNGVAFDSPTSHPIFDHVTFEDGRGADIRISAPVLNAHFYDCWWEFPPKTMVDVRAQVIGFIIEAPQIDGSNLSGGRSFMVANSGGHVLDIAFLGGRATNLNGGYLLTVPADPKTASDPGFADVTIDRMNFDNPDAPILKGLYPTTLSPRALNRFRTRQLNPSKAIVPNATGGLIPYISEAAGTVTGNVPFSLQHIDSLNDIAFNGSPYRAIWSSGGSLDLRPPGGTGSISFVGRGESPVGRMEVLTSPPLFDWSGAIRAATYQCTHGVNATCGVAWLSNGAAIVGTSAIGALSTGAAGYVVSLTVQACSSCGQLSVGSVTPGRSFVIRSQNPGDASTVFWEIRYIN